MLALLLPGVPAAAADGSCPGRPMYSQGNRNYYRHCPSHAGCHKKKICYTSGTDYCQHVCNNCC